MHRITLRQIHIFETVARYQSHTKAAAIIHMTQPAVSMQMKQLEETFARAYINPTKNEIIEFYPAGSQNGLEEYQTKKFC